MWGYHGWRRSEYKSVPDRVERVHATLIPPPTHVTIIRLRCLKAAQHTWRLIRKVVPQRGILAMCEIGFRILPKGTLLVYGKGGVVGTLDSTHTN